VPVIMGKARSKQLSHNTGNYGDESESVNKVSEGFILVCSICVLLYHQVLCLQIHGDAALSAQVSKCVCRNDSLSKVKARTYEIIHHLTVTL